MPSVQFRNPARKRNKYSAEILVYGVLDYYLKNDCIPCFEGFLLFLHRLLSPSDHGNNKRPVYKEWMLFVPKAGWVEGIAPDSYHVTYGGPPPDCHASLFFRKE